MKKHRNRIGHRAHGKSRSTTSKRTVKPYLFSSFEQLESRTLLTASPLQNLVNPLDVNSDGHVSSLDALTVINDLSRNGPHEASFGSNASGSQTMTLMAMDSTDPPLYVDVNGDGIVSSLDALQIINAMDTVEGVPSAQIRLVTTDLNGNPITTIDAGQDFQLRAFVKDTSTDDDPDRGVYAAYLDVSYNDKATISSSATVTFGPSYTSVKSKDLSVAGFINETGATASSFDPLGDGEFLLWTIPVHAAVAGTEIFTPGAATGPGHDVLVYGSDVAVDPSNVTLLSTSIQIGGTAPALELSIDDVSKNEGNTTTTNFVFNVSLSTVPTQTVTVQYTAADGSAQSPADYAATSGTLTFNAGQTSLPITVGVVGETAFEPAETFTVTLSNATGGATIVKAIGTGNIFNDDVITSPALSISDVLKNEGNESTTDFVFNVSLTTAATETVTVQYATEVGTAHSPSDYAATSGTLTFSPGVTSLPVTVAVVGDTTDEIDELFTVKLSNPSAGTAFVKSTGSGTIVNDDFDPAVSISDVTVNRPTTAGATANAVFTVTLIGSTDLAKIVEYATQDGTATAPTDYTATSGMLTFAPGTTVQTITVQVKGDGIYQGNESFRVNLRDPFSTSGGVLDSADAVLIEQLPAPTLSISDVSKDEGNSSTTDFDFNVTLSAPADIPITVQYATADGTAHSPLDYAAKSGTLTFAAGTTSQPITVSVNGDTTFETGESFAVNLTNATVDITKASGAGTIANDDTQPSIAIGNVLVDKPTVTNGTVDAIFTVTLSNGSEIPATVAYATADGTAVAPTNYASTSGTLTFASGVTAQTVTVVVRGDGVFDGNLDFFVNLTSPTNASIATAQGTGTIRETLVGPSLSITDVSHSEGNTDTTDYVFNVTLSLPSSQVVTVQYATAPDTAQSPSDFTATSGTLTFAVGETSKPVTVTVTADTALEQNESFKVNLTNASKAGISKATGIGTIVDDDSAPTLAINNVTVVKPASGTGTAVFEVKVSGSTNLTTTVAFATANGTATAPTNYTATSGTLTFAPGVTAQNITVPVVGNATFQNDLTFLVNLTAPSNATITTGQGTGTIKSTPVVPGITVNDVSQFVGTSGQTNFVFVITMSASTTNTVNVQYATADGTAHTPTDYTGTSGTLTFAPGVTTQSVTVPVFGVTAGADSKTFLLNLSNPVNGTLTRAQATGTAFQNFQPSTLSGIVFLDFNGNSTRDSSNSEWLVQNRTIKLIGTDSTNTPIDLQTVTDVNGSYSFANLKPGTYTLSTVTNSALVSGHAIPGSQGGTAPDASHIQITIPAGGGVTGTGNNFAEKGYDPDFFSQRLFMKSNQPTNGAINLANTKLFPASSTTSTAAINSLSATNSTPTSSARVTLEGTTVTVHGTSDDDHFEFTAGVTDTLTINGQNYQFDPAKVHAIVFDGGEGDNTAILNGSNDDDTATLNLGSGVLAAAAYNVSVSNVGSLTVNGGGGNNQAVLNDSAFDDHLTAQGNQASISNDQGFAMTVQDFDTVKTKSTNGGHDTKNVGAIDFALEQEGTWLSS